QRPVADVAQGDSRGWGHRRRPTGRIVRCLLALALHWSQLHAIRIVGPLGASFICHCVALSLRGERPVSLVASLLFCSIIRNLFLHRAQHLRSANMRNKWLGTWSLAVGLCVVMPQRATAQG